MKKVWTNNGVTSTSYYVHNALGQLAAEYSTVAPAGGTTYIHTDMLGSTRMVTDATGAPVDCYDYSPFGRTLTSNVNARGTGCYPANLDDETGSPVTQKFTGKERDAETKLDFFGARYYSAAQGRWTTPDWSAAPVPVPYADLSNPQTLNLYQYVGNNPISIRDADGHCWPISECAHSVMDAVTHARERIEQKVTGLGSPALAAYVSYQASNVEGTVHMLVNPFTVGEASGRVWDSGTTKDRVLAGLDDGLKGVAVAGMVAGPVSSALGKASSTLSKTAEVADSVGIGKFAGESIPASSTARNFTKLERAEINHIGSETGCHTCGTTGPGTKSGNFVPDHQPPSALNPEGGAQRLYPQCINCSREQGLEIARRLRRESSQQ